jgi:predicted nucleotidyltransferase
MKQSLVKQPRQPALAAASRYALRQTGAGPTGAVAANEAGHGGVDQSPRMVAQRRLASACFGAHVQGAPGVMQLGNSGGREKAPIFTDEEIHEYTDACDAAFIALLEALQADYPDAQVSVYAAGSYGRREAVRGSDLDYFVQYDPENKASAQFVQALQKRTSLRVGHPWAEEPPALEQESFTAGTISKGAAKSGELKSGRHIFSTNKAPKASPVLVGAHDGRTAEVIIDDLRRALTKATGTRKALFQGLAKLVIILGQLRVPPLQSIEPVAILQALGAPGDLIAVYIEMRTLFRSADVQLSSKAVKDAHRALFDWLERTYRENKKQ